MTLKERQELAFLKDKVRGGRGNGIGPGNKNLGKWMARIKVLSRSPGAKKLHKMSAEPTRSSLRQSLRPNKSKKK